MWPFNQKKKQVNPLLVGEWRSGLNDVPTRETFGKTKITFTKKGNLTWEIYEGDKLQIMNLVCWSEDDILFSDQPSAPKIEQTRFSFENADILILEFEGTRTRYLKTTRYGKEK